MQSSRLLLKISTCFGVGHISKFPGTLGSLLAFIFLPLFYFNGFSFAFLTFSPALFFLFTFCCKEYEKFTGKHDLKEVIIDELFAQLSLFCLVDVFFCRSSFLVLCTLSFILFRFFDIIKPWPICAVDKKVKGGIGVMLDDVVAAVFSFAVLALVKYFIF